jgi:outer membrane protein assembly factor BamB
VKSTGKRLLRFCTLALAGAVAATVAAPASASAAGGEWRVDGYGPTNSGQNPAETAVTKTTVGDLTPKLTLTSPPADEWSCYRQRPPVVSGGRVFVSESTGIVAYDQGTGEQVWRSAFVDPNDETTPQLAVADGRLVATSNGCQSVSDPDGKLVIFDAANGSVLATVHRDAPIDTLLVDRGIAVVSGEDIYGSVVTAYRISDGGKLWQLGGAWLGGPVSAGGRVMVTRGGEDPDSGDVITPGTDMVDIATGAVLWHSDTVYQVRSAHPSGDRVYAAGPDYALLALDAGTGAVAWSVPAAGATQVSVGQSRVFATNSGVITGYEAGSGRVLWSRTFTGALGKPVLAGGVLYATVDGVRVHALNPANGRSFDAPAFDRAVGHPVIVDGRVYVTDGKDLVVYGL